MSEIGELAVWLALFLSVVLIQDSPSLGCQNNERSTLASIEAMTICNQFNALVLYLSGHIELMVKKLQILTQTNHVILVPVATDIQRGIFCIEEESILVVVDHSTIECVLFEKGQRDETEDTVQRICFFVPGSP